MSPLYFMIALCLTVASGSQTGCATDTTGAGAADASQGTCLLQSGKGMRRTATAAEEAEFQSLVSKGQKRMSLDSHKDCQSMLRPHIGAKHEELLQFCNRMKYPSEVCHALRSAVGNEPLTTDRMEGVCREVSHSVALLHRSAGISKAASAEAYGEALEWSLWRKSSDNTTSTNETADGNLSANETAEANTTEAPEEAEPATEAAPAEANGTAAPGANATANATGNASLMAHKHLAHHKHHAAHKDKAHHKKGAQKHKGGHQATHKDKAHHKHAKH